MMLNRLLSHGQCHKLSDNVISLMTNNIYLNQSRSLHYSRRNFCSVTTQDNSTSEVSTPTNNLINKPSNTKFIYTDNFPEELRKDFAESFLIYEDFVTKEEETNLMDEGGVGVSRFYLDILILWAIFIGTDTEVG